MDWEVNGGSSLQDLMGKTSGLVLLPENLPVVIIQKDRHFYTYTSGNTSVPQAITGYALVRTQDRMYYYIPQAALDCTFRPPQRTQ